MLVIPDEEGRLKTTVYRKPTHTNQYLHWDSHHAIPSKYSVIGTLFTGPKPSALDQLNCRKKKSAYITP